MKANDIQTLIQTGDTAQIIYELQNGRKYPAASTETISQLNPYKHNVMNKAERKDKLVNVDTSDDSDFNTGTISSDGVKYRLEPVARVALAIQKLIVSRAVSFTFGNPVILNCEPKNNSEQKVLDAVQSVLLKTKIRTINRLIAKSLYSTTEVAELWYPYETTYDQLYGFSSGYKLKCSVFSPLFGDKLYPYFDEQDNLIAFSRQYSRRVNETTEETFFETYTDNAYYKWQMDNDWKLIEQRPNAIGKIPIVYGQQTKTEWEDVQPLIERLEKLLSNFADTNDYHASPKIFTTGTILGWAKKGESGAVIEGEDGATAQYLSWNNAPQSVQLEIDTLLRMIYTITQTPDISFDTVKGIGGVSGIALKLLFMDAHLKVKEKQEVWDDYLQRRISIILAFLQQLNVRDNQFVEACNNIMIEPEITPFMLEDDQAKVALLSSAVGGGAIASRKVAVTKLGWVKNVNQELSNIAEDEASAQVEDMHGQEYEPEENEE